MKTLEAKSLVLLKHHLKALRLPTVGAECEKVANQAAADNVDHLTYLLQLLELELLDREKRSADRRLKAAKFPTIKTLDAFDFAARPSVNKVLIAELARCEFIDKRENLLMVGNPGTGKSHLAIALAAQACARGYKVRFYRATDLVSTLIEARDERTFMRLKTQLARLDLLVLDELGYVPASKVGAELLVHVISTPYERTSMIVTTNLPFESWTEVLGSERLTGATLDRLTHRCHIIETRGESHRRQDATSPSEVRRRAQRNIAGARCQFQARGRRKDQPLACCRRAVVFDRRALSNWTGVYSLEFKSSLRWDYDKGSTNRDLEGIVVKTIAGFLNGEGGNLLIGVDDAKTVLGLNPDYQSSKSIGNRDGFERHLNAIVRGAVGDATMCFILATFHTISSKDICQVSVD